MSPVSRRIAFGLFATALVAAGCSSNNTGKIVGKWKASIAELGLHAPPNVQGYGVLEFTADNKYILTAHIDQGGGMQTRTAQTATYKLGWGDTVNLTDISPPLPDKKTRSRETIKIDGDRMTVTMKEGKTATFTRMN